MTALDLAALRADTPGCAHRIHLNNAGAALPPRPVVDAMVGHLELEARIGGYEAAAEAAPAVGDAYAAVADLVGGAPDEVAVVENATRAWDMAFYALPFGPGDRILCAQSEYASNVIAFLQAARRTGAVVEPIPDDGDGALDVAELERRIDGRVKLIAVTHVPTNGGLINPAAEIGAVARRHGVPYLLDACQSIGQIPVDVAAIGCDMLSATARKFLRGPRGVGFLWVRREMIARLEPPFLDLHAARWTAPDAYEIRPDARRFENWERSFAAQIGLGVAARYALGLGLPAIAARARALAADLRERLAAIPGATVTDKGRDKGAIVCLRHDRLAAGAIKAALGGQGINVSVTDPASTLFDATARGLPDLVRLSPHCYNTEAEIAAAADAVRAAVAA